MLDSTQHWVGTNDVLLSVYDAGAASLAESGTALHVELIGPSGQAFTVDPAIERFATYGRSLYRARVPARRGGSLGGARRPADAAARPGRASPILDVSPDDGTPALGSLVPGGATPTMRDAHSLMHHISSDIEPLSAFYTWSLDEAISQHQPTVFILDSYAARPNAACGGALGLLHDIFIEYPGLVVVHAEPWRTAPGAGRHAGARSTRRTARAHGLRDGVGRQGAALGVRHRPDGRLYAKFTGVLGSDELRAALTSVASWRPAA